MYSPAEIESKRLKALALKNKSASSGNVPVNRTTETNKNIRSNENNLPATPSNSWPISNAQWGKTSSRGLKQQQQVQKNLNELIKTNNFYRTNEQKITGNFHMIANDRFAVDLSKFHTPVIDVFRTIPSKSYDSPKRMWNFHLKDYWLLFEKLKQRSDIKVTGLPKFTKETFEKLIDQKDENKIDLSGIDEVLLESLLPFQREGIRFGVSKNAKCMIADDMGLGKTIQALGLAHYYKEDWPLLIVTPSSVRYQWSEAIFRFLPSVPVHHVRQFTKSKDGFEMGEVTIVSYDLLARSIDDFEKHHFGIVIFDESHFLKSSKTVRYKAAQRIAAGARHVILLSGTPVLSRPIELHSQINLIKPNFMGYAEYGIRYCAGVQSKFGWDMTGSSNLHELDFLLKAFCLIRRVKTDVLNQLPAKVRQVVVLDPYLIEVGTKEMEESALKLQRKTLTSSERHSALLQYYSESSHAKRKAICNYVTDLLEKREKFLLFAHHQVVLDSVCDVLKSKKTKYIRIDGRTNPEQRKYFVDSFQDDKDIMVAVLSITAANSGITLTAARLVVFAELTWNPGILVQAEDRVHRIGQERGVVIQYLLAKNTADDYLWPKIQHKIDILNKVGLEQDFEVNTQDVSAQKPPEDSDQKKMDPFVTGSTPSKSNGTPRNVQFYTSKRPNASPPSSSRKKQMKLDPFVSSATLDVDSSTNENSFDRFLAENEFTVESFVPQPEIKSENSFDVIIKDEDFDSIDFDEF
ncbi:SWI/SNF-related matrix-associated actin-dependent regulator of chromatin subfamily A-like protein 1 isoform X2 [Belonocnema kinseyi]|nr:SWI/SNF-related matrix-associated actin-dependent regulator of chromatin subfamily A-like protein 1 isoform X2 [Belonocnema kinseyi]XP_033228268.1 SWI/SNF-related matrix-associated actin-dependent regulator of chromatin subfamily A-like protein 1 isoform X2 [Belonocnema kinseyi]